MFPNAWSMLFFYFRITDTRMEERFLFISWYKSIHSKIFWFGWGVFILFSLVLFCSTGGKVIWEDSIPKLHREKSPEIRSACQMEVWVIQVNHQPPLSVLSSTFMGIDRVLVKRIAQLHQACGYLFKEEKQTHSFFFHLIIFILMCV